MAFTKYDLSSAGFDVYAAKGISGGLTNYQVSEDNANDIILLTFDDSGTPANADEIVFFLGIVDKLPSSDGNGNIKLLEINLPSAVAPSANFQSQNEALGIVAPIPELKDGRHFLSRKSKLQGGVVISKPNSKRLQIIKVTNNWQRPNLTLNSIEGYIDQIKDLPNLNDLSALISFLPGALRKIPDAEYSPKTFDFDHFAFIGGYVKNG